MSADAKSRGDAPAVAQQRFLSLFLRGEREVFRYVAALVPNVADAEDIVQQTALRDHIHTVVGRYKGSHRTLAAQSIRTGPASTGSSLRMSTRP